MELKKYQNKVMADLSSFMNAVDQESIMYFHNTHRFPSRRNHIKRSRECRYPAAGICFIFLCAYHVMIGEGSGQNSVSSRPRAFLLLMIPTHLFNISSFLLSLSPFAISFEKSIDNSMISLE